MRDAGPAVARHPDALPINAAIQLAAAAVLLHEGVEERRRITAVLLPRIELLCSGWRAAGITDLRAAASAHLADPESAGLKRLRFLLRYRTG
jgi:hypothetical protein